MQTSSPPVIAPNRSQSNPDDMIALPRSIQSVGVDLHDVSGTSTGQTLPRERRAPPGTHLCPTSWWVHPPSATIFILHPLLSTFSSTFVRNIKQQLQGSCARVRKIQNARRRNHLRMVRGGAQTHTVCSSSCKDLAPGSAGSKRQASYHLRTVRGGAQTHTRSAAAAARILRPSPQDPNARRRNHLRISMMSRAETKSVFYHPPLLIEKGMGIPTFVHSPKSNKNPLF